VSLRTLITAPIQRPKAMFYFYSPLRTIFDSPRVSDTTSVSTISTTRTNAKTYTLSIPTGANTIRVIVHGRSGSGYTMTVILNIDGVDVASATIDTGGATVVVLDYIGSITPGSRTIRIDYYASTANTVTISAVYIATGIGLTSTTLTTIRSFTVTYQLVRSGDIRYSPGVRVFVFGNRKTTAPLSLTIPEATSITTGRNNLGAGNDNDKAETILAILTGSVTFQEGGEFTVSATLRGNVGASGDTVIITRILARAQLRRETSGVGEVRVYERGVAEYLGRARLVSVPGGVTYTQHNLMVRDVLDRIVYETGFSGAGTDITTFNFKVAVATPIHFALYTSYDSSGEAYLEWVQLVVWG
jgi:hypothetical protein